jgi:hypothetical protein
MTTWSSTEKLALGAALALGVVFVLSRRKTSESAKLDPDLPEDHEDIVRMALTRERDPAILHSLAAKLGAAGHHRSAEAAASRAEQVRGSYYTGF